MSKLLHKNQIWMPLMVDTFFYENKTKHNFYQNMTSGKLREDINDLKESIDFIEKGLKGKFWKAEYGFCKLKGKVTKVEEDLKYMNDYIEDIQNIDDKMAKLEHLSRRNNIRINGVKDGVIVSRDKVLTPSSETANCTLE